MIRRPWIGVAVAVVLTGAALADRFDPASPPLPAAETVDAPGGVWICPVVKVAGTGGWLHMLNAGTSAAEVHVTFLADGRNPVDQTFALAARRTTTIGTPPQIARYPAGAIVEYAGGDVTVSRTVLFVSGPRTAVGAASCARPSTATVVVPQGTTLNADTHIAILNPGTADAVVDVALLVEGQRVEPASLHGRVVPSRGRLVVREGDFAFDAPAIGAAITARSGRVVVDGIVLHPSVLEIVPGTTATHEVVAVGSSARGQIRFSTLAIGDEDAVTRGIFLSSAGQTAYEPLTAELPPNSPRVSGPPADVKAGPVALAVRSATAAIAAGARWEISTRAGSVETAASTGMPPARKAAVVLGPPTQTSNMRLIIANPDVRDAFVDIAVFTEGAATAPSPLQNVRVAAGHATTITFGGVAPTATLGLIISSDGGRIGGALEGFFSAPAAFGAYAATAIPASTTPIVAVEPDARQGVPAP